MFSDISSDYFVPFFSRFLQFPYWKSHISLFHSFFIQCRLHTTRPIHMRNVRPYWQVRTKCLPDFSTHPSLCEYRFKPLGRYSAFTSIMSRKADFIISNVHLLIVLLMSFASTSCIMIVFMREILQNFFSILIFHLFIIAIILSFFSFLLQVLTPSFWSAQIRVDSVHSVFRCDIISSFPLKFLCISPSGKSIIYGKFSRMIPSNRKCNST